MEISPTENIPGSEIGAQVEGFHDQFVESHPTVPRWAKLVAAAVIAALPGGVTGLVVLAALNYVRKRMKGSV